MARDGLTLTLTACGRAKKLRTNSKSSSAYARAPLLSVRPCRWTTRRTSRADKPRLRAMPCMIERWLDISASHCTRMRSTVS